MSIDLCLNIPITNSTPQVVLDELSSIGKNQTVSDPPKAEDLPFIVRFVNPSVSWTKKPLLEAFNNLIKYQKLQPIPNLDNVGNPAPKNPLALPSRILYGLCVQNKIQTFRETTAYQMKDGLEFLKNGKVDLVKAAITASLNNDLSSMIDLFMYSQTKSPLKEERVTTSDIYNASEEVVDLSTRQPTSASQAVYLAAKNYKTDISRSKYPQMEYIRLKYNDFYIPYDPDLHQIWSKNSRVLNLKTYFNPYFPETVYDREDLNYLALQEGYNPQEEMSYYNFLQESSLLKTFVHGLQLTTLNDLTPISRDSVSVLDSNDVLSFGTVSDGYTVVSYTELIDYLEYKKQLVNPLESGEPPLSSGEINKLKVFGNVYCHRNLTKIIKSIEENENEYKYKGGELRELYMNVEDEEKEKIVFALKSLLDLGFYMRGWDGKKDLPLSEAPVENQNEVDICVTQATNSFHVALLSLEETSRRKILDLPLQKYGNGRFIYNSDESQGISIEKRLEILKDNERLEACIRLTSNWFLTTAFFYLSALGFTPAWDINQMVSVS
jgi:hypothetical protein